MKKLLLLFVLGASSSTLSAPVHAASRLQKAPIQWPTIGPKNANDYFDERIAAIQYLLRARGFYKSKVDGIFGPQTTRALKAFQKQQKLRVDGVANPQTLPRLVSVVKRGSRGDAVRAAQILARAATGHNGETPNLGLEVDGTFGAETQQAIRAAQECRNGLEERLVVNGVMDARSWCLMLRGRVVGDENG